MERKFYPENFERFLKGHADQFKMTPSKKVWHGIYNDLHPGRRWPSIAMSIVFVLTLVIIGHLNTNNGSDTTLHDMAGLTNSNEKKSTKTSKAKKPAVAKRVITQYLAKGNYSTDNTDINTPNEPPLLTVPTDLQPLANSKDILQETTLTNTQNIRLKDKEIPATAKVDNDVTQISNQDEQVDGLDIPVKSIEDATNDKTSLNTTQTTSEIETQPVTKTIINTLVQASAENIQKPKRTSNVTWSYYISPSLSYRTFSDEKMSNSVNHTKILGYEGGAAMSFPLIKKLHMTTGFQVNYSGYNIRANSTHPIITTLVLNDESQLPYTYYTMSHYGNNSGAEFIKLKNFSLQVSLPIGLQYVFAGNDNIKFGAGASVQPSYVISSQAYLLSQDKKNYLTNPDLFRRWNVNTNLTTYVSLSSNSFNWQIGPQIRYQLLSTYSKHYPVKEHLINYGLRIGISKSK